MSAKNIPIRESCMDDIISLARKNSVTIVILFGSRARNDYWRGSDIDLAIKGGDALAYYGDLEEKADTLLHFDVVDLDRVTDPELLKDIKRDGVILYEKV